MIQNTNEKMMKVSKIVVGGDEVLVETRTGSLAVIRNVGQLVSYIKQYGNVEVVFDPEAFRPLYRVPAFKESIAKYSEAKQIACRRYGCE